MGEEPYIRDRDLQNAQNKEKSYLYIKNYSRIKVQQKCYETKASSSRLPLYSDIVASIFSYMINQLCIRIHIDLCEVQRPIVEHL